VADYAQQQDILAAAARSDLLAWVVYHRVKTPKGQPLEFVRRPYLVALYQDDSPNIVVMKGAQIGVSTWAILDALRFCMVHRDPAVTVIFTQPTSDDAHKFSSTRVAPIIAASEYLATRWEGGVEVRRVGRPNPSIIHFRGTWVEKEAYTIDSDQNTHDELDKSKPDVREVYDERLGASQFKRTRDISTPTIPNWGIAKLFEQTDQHEWLVSCTGCSWEGPIDYYQHLDRKAGCFRCPKCGKKLIRSNGRWVAKYPDRLTRGYRISQAFAPFIPVGPDHLRGSLMWKEKNTRLKRNFLNFTLGLPSAEGVGQISRELILQKCFVKGYPHQEAAVGTVMGVDVGNVKHAEIAYVQRTGMVDADGVEVIRRDIIHLETTPSWQRLGQLMHTYGVEVCVVDAMPMRDEARNFARQFPGRVFCCDYGNISEPVRWRGKEPYFILAERTQTLNMTADYILKGYTQLYGPPDGVIDDVQGGEGWIQHWENMRWVYLSPEETRDDQPHEEWRSVGPDHWAHADNYCAIAALKWKGPVKLPSADQAVAGPRAFTSKITPQGRGLPEPKRPPERRRIFRK